MITMPPYDKTMKKWYDGPAGEVELKGSENAKVALRLHSAQAFVGNEVILATTKVRVCNADNKRLC